MSVTQSQSLWAHVQRKLLPLCGSIEGNTAKGRAQLAELRRGIGKHPGALPALYAVWLGDMPEELQGNSFRGPSRAEWAAYTAITLFALHQQGKSACMHAGDERKSLGRAVGELAAQDPDGAKGIKRRLDALMTAVDMTEVAHHARGLIQLLRAAERSIPLSYTQLAVDLFDFQSEYARDKVRLNWGRDYVNALTHARNDDDNQEEL